MSSELKLIGAAYIDYYWYAKVIKSLKIPVLSDPYAKGLLLALLNAHKRGKTPFDYSDFEFFIKDNLTPSLLVRAHVVDEKEAQMFLESLPLQLNMIIEALPRPLNEEELINILNYYIARAYVDIIKNLSERGGASEDLLKRIQELSLRAQIKLIRKRDKILKYEMEKFLEKISDPTNPPWKEYTTGYQTLDELLHGGFKSSELIVIAGTPGSGKTSFALNIMYNMMRAGYKVAFFSLEISSMWIVKRLLSIMTGAEERLIRKAMQLEHLQSSLSSDELAYLQELRAQIEGAVASIPEDIRLYDVSINRAEDIIQEAIHLKQEDGLDAVFIDYLQLMSTNVTAKSSRYVMISEIINSLKMKLAKELDIPVIVLSQFNRNVRGNRKRNMAPDMTDLRDSGMIEATADVIIALNAEPEPDEDKNKLVTLHVLKARHAETGDLTFRFHGPTFRFFEEGNPTEQKQPRRIRPKNTENKTESNDGDVDELFDF